MNEGIKKVEELLFQNLSPHVSLDDLPLVFILASPRTGSTLLYQLLINFFDFFYFPNLVNDYFAEFPVVGAALDLLLNPRQPVSYESAYGKTQGYSAPSEGSFIFRNWFGGEHPSQTRSCEVLPGKVTHLISTMKSIYELTGQSVLTKNAWNCFRIQALTQLFPNIHFIWVRRDIALSALSDLEARYRRGGGTVWNSATTANYRDIQKRPYWEQVVEQQYEYNKSIARDLSKFSQGRHIELWYEDVCDHTEAELSRIDQYLVSQSLPTELKNRPIPSLNRSSGPHGLKEDHARILRYVAAHTDRFHGYTYDNRVSLQERLHPSRYGGKFSDS